MSTGRLRAGQVAHVAGYANPGDGGGGFFYFQPGNGSSEDGGIVVAADDGKGQWIRDRSDVVDVRWFGAIGDGKTDDTQALRLALGAGRGRVVSLSSGIFQVLGELRVPGDTRVTGKGAGATVIRQAQNSSRIFVIEDVSNVTIENLTLRGGDAPVIDIQAVARSVFQTRLSNIDIQAMGPAGTGVNLAAQTEAHFIGFTCFDNVRICGGDSRSWGDKVGIRLGGTAGSSVVGTNIFGGRIWRTQSGIHLQRCDTVFAFGLAFDDIHGSALRFDVAHYNRFLSCRWEVGTFGKYADFSESSSDNFIDPIAAAVQPTELTDRGARNGWMSGDGSGGVVNRVPNPIEWTGRQIHETSGTDR